MKDRLVTIALSVAATFGLLKADENIKELEVDRLIVRKELIVSDTGEPWEKGYEEHQMPRGIYARSLGDGAGGLWVRSRLIKGEIDDPFDDRFNPHGGAIALGHPYGMTGARIMCTLLNDLEAVDGTIGLETMCVGGGQGMAMIVERL